MNVKPNVVPLSGYMREVMKAVDDAEWLSDFDTADTLKTELDHLNLLEKQGETWYPLF